jgi:CDP-6-deoxy-D-xylo-4-hexulose-3-dehydrase
MITDSMVNFEPQIDKLRSQISELVEQYANLAYAPKPFVPGQTPVAVSDKVIGAKELQRMVEALLDGWLTTSRFNALFETRMAKLLGVKHV